MTEQIKEKIVLKEKGQEASISLKQLVATLKWTDNVDLDLMGFYEAKDGRKGAVFTNLLPGGFMGDLNAFPFIQLSGDAGVGEAGGDNEEVMRITKLDDIKTLYIITLNYTDASQRKKSKFSNYNGRVELVDDKGGIIEVPLDSSDVGNVAIIAKIDNSSPIGPKLVNENRIVDMATFKQEIPAGDTLLQGH